MLTVDNAPQYLIERGLLSAQSVIDGDLTIVSAARRNRNLRVTRREGAGYLIKQPDDPSLGGQHSLRWEASFYAFCHEEPAAEPMKELLPRMLFFDYEQSLVALELLEGAVPLRDFFSRSEAADFPFQAAGSVGRALGVFHRTFRQPDVSGNRRLSWLRRDVPWVMQVHKPGPELLSSISPANYQTLKIIQTQEKLSEHLNGLRQLWQPQTVIHNDIKSDNILVGPANSGGEAKAAPKVYIIDWELVQIGDAAWDVAGALQDFILFWVSTMTNVSGSPEEMAASARYPLPVLQSAVRTLWRAYRAAARLAADEADALITRAVRFSAARLIQTAFEMAQLSQVLPVPSVLLLQISANLLADAEAGQVQLYGLFQEVKV